MAPSVSPEILIVGDVARRSGLTERVETLGYQISDCSLEHLTVQVRDGDGPAAIILCAEGPEAAVVMSDLRRTRRGVSIPVTLCGHLGGTIRDLADVLDLGADHFLEEPFGDDALAAALNALAGPPGLGPEPEPDPPTAVGIDTPLRTEIIDGIDDSGSGGSHHSSSGGAKSIDPAIGQLGRTLDLLEERLRTRAGNAAESSDELELSLLGLEPAPSVDAESGTAVLDPAQSHGRLDRVQPGALRTVEPGGGRGPVSPREPTIRLEGQSPLPASGETTAGWRDVSSARVPFDEDEASGPVLHDKPRRRTPLPVEQQGRVEDLEIPRLLWKLHRARYSGQVELTRGRTRKSLWMERGEVVFARSTVGADRLVDGLLRRGLLTKEQYEAARSLAAKEPRRVGQLMVEAGFIKPAELPVAIRAQVRSIVDSTFSWTEGGWALEPEVRCDETVRLERTMSRLVMDGVRDRLEVAQAWALLGGPRVFAALRRDARPAGIVADLGLSDRQRDLLRVLDGRADLGTLCSAPGADEPELLATAYGLHVLELVDLTGEALPDAARNDPAELDRTRVEDRLRLVREADYFEILGLARDATAADVRRAHGALLLTFDDGHLEAEVRAEMKPAISEIRRALDDACQMLRDDDLRLAYLAHLEIP